MVDCYIFSAVLDNIEGLTDGDPYPYCLSTITITPGRLDDQTSAILRCNTSMLMDLKVTCSVSGHNETVPPKSLMLEAAGIIILKLQL